MPKNTGMGGNKRKKGKKQTTEARELVYKGEMEEYGQVLRMLGDARLEIQCIDGVKRIGHIRGKMRKRNWIAMGDVVLVSLREYENEKCDVVEKYNEDEVRKLKKAGEIPDSINLPDQEDKQKDNDNNDNIVFEDDENEDDWKKKRNDLPSDDSNSDEEDQKDIDVDKI